MIRINLLAVERKSAATATFALQDSQKIAICCGALLIVTATGVGYRYWTDSQTTRRLDKDISAAQKEAARLRIIISQVQQFEQHKAQLQQRVTLIEQLRREQSGPVHILDQINRAVPPLLWLTELKQGADQNAIVINGKCTNLSALPDFVKNLEASGYFKKSIEIVNTRTETPAGMGEIVTFSLLAQFQRPGDAAPATMASAADGKAAGKTAGQVVAKNE
jgi:type IV pilus assembly protein PilN